VNALWKRRLWREPDGGNLHVRFDEGEGSGGHWSWDLSSRAFLSTLLVNASWFIPPRITRQTPATKPAERNRGRTDPVNPESRDLTPWASSCFDRIPTESTAAQKWISSLPSFPSVESGPDKTPQKLTKLTKTPDHGPRTTVHRRTDSLARPAALALPAVIGGRARRPR